MNFSPGTITQDLKAIEQFESKFPLGLGLESQPVGVLRRHDYLAKIVAADLEQAGQWRCYFLAADRVPVALLQPLTLKEALLLYRADLYHDDPEDRNVITVALLRGGQVAGTTLVCPEFLGYALTRFASKNVLPYSAIVEEIGSEDEFLDEYLKELMNSASREEPRQFRILDLSRRCPE